MRKLLCITILSFFVCLTISAQQNDNEEGRGIYKTRTLFNLEKFWDSTTVLKNPHKGWELHYFDNGIKRYGTRLKPDDFLADFPGLHTIYLRLAWSFLEPEEGKFNWQVIDTVINKTMVSPRPITNMTRDCNSSINKPVKHFCLNFPNQTIANGCRAGSWENITSSIFRKHCHLANTISKSDCLITAREKISLFN